MQSWRAVGAATRYEFTMQLRRIAVWIGFGLFAILLLFILNSLINQLGKQLTANGVVYSRHDIVIQWATSCNFILVVGAGLLIADRYPRDRSTRVLELLRTTPAPLWTRLLGKYLGSVLATLVPIFVVFCTGTLLLVVRWQDPSVVPMALAAGLALLVPAVFFVGAFSIACTHLLWTPLYQFLFVGYCAWTSLNPGESIPTLSGTLLSPSENYVVTGFFHFATYYPQDAGFYPASSVWLGILNILVLLACAALALLAAWRIEIWQASRQ